MSEPVANEPELIDVEAVATAVIADVVEMSRMPAFLDQAFSTLAELLESQSVNPARWAAFAGHHRPVTDTADLRSASPRIDP